MGIVLSATILLSWLLTEIFAIYHYPWSTLTVLCAPVLIAALTWLDVGLFIIAHDCMHGAVLPHSSRANRWLGQLCLLVYAGFAFDTMCAKHHEHHQYPGSAHDPDFARSPRARFWPWYLGFFRTYSTVRQLLVISVLFWCMVLVFDASISHLLVFWALPAILSSLQLFYFGTYLPHRPQAAPFADAHHARSNDYPPWLSLLTCFHFGYHHEHHLSPNVPWWNLPVARARRRAGAAE